MGQSCWQKDTSAGKRATAAGRWTTAAGRRATTIGGRVTSARRWAKAAGRGAIIAGRRAIIAVRIGGEKSGPSKQNSPPPRIPSPSVQIFPSLDLLSHKMEGINQRIILMVSLMYVR
jgi:hypothetical protein